MKWTVITPDAPEPSASWEAPTLTPGPHICPVCTGQGHVSRPPWVPGDWLTWTDSTTGTYQCPACHGHGVLWRDT